jgi:hypothetical protein
MRFKRYLTELYIQEAKEDPLVKYALENYPKLFTDKQAGYGREGNPIYYVTTGQKGVYYTLRYRFLENVYGKDPVTGAAFSRGTVERDYLVLTLGPNPEKAVERLVKENPNHGYSERNPIHVSPIELKPKMKDRPADMIKFGKHWGKSVYQVAEEDPDYVFWMFQQPWIEQKYKTFVPHLRNATMHPKVAPLVNQWKIGQMESDVEKEEKKEKEILKKARMKEMESIISGLEDAYQSDFVRAMIDKLRAGQDPAKDWTQRMIEITGDVYAKAVGGRRGSKKYNAAFDYYEDVIFGKEDK